jgi:hypothetical protein
MKKTKSFILIITTAILFYNCESNTEDLTTDPIGEPQEDSELNRNLSFEEVYAFEDDLLGGPYIGMTYSSNDNNLFISSRENAPAGSTTEEEVFKLSLDSYQLMRKNVSPGGFITKQLTTINDTLVSIGGTEFKFYDTSFEYAGEKSYGNNFTLSKFGIATHNNDTYIIGGYRVDGPSRENKKIRKLRGNITGNQFEEFINTSETMIGASGAVVNEKLHVFGGAYYENLTEPTNKIFIYPLNNPQSYEEFSMTVKADVTFVHKYGEMILVAGHKGLYGTDKTSFVGLFDTTTNTFEEIKTNLDSESGTKAIHQMIVKEDKIIVLFGHKASSQLPMSKWSILSADLLKD